MEEISEDICTPSPGEAGRGLLLRDVRADTNGVRSILRRVALLQ